MCHFLLLPLPKSGYLRVFLTPHQARMVWIWLQSLELYVVFERITLPDRRPISRQLVRRLAKNFCAAGFRKRNSAYLEPIGIVVERWEAMIILEMQSQHFLRTPTLHRSRAVDVFCNEIRRRLDARRGRPTTAAGELFAAAMRPGLSDRQRKRLWKRADGDRSAEPAPREGLAQYLRQI